MPVFEKYQGWYVYFWANEEGEPIHFHIAKGQTTANATKIWILKDGTFKLAHNRSEVPIHILRRIYSLMLLNLEEYEKLWLDYQKDLTHIDD